VWRSHTRRGAFWCGENERKRCPANLGVKRTIGEKKKKDQRARLNREDGARSRTQSLGLIKFGELKGKKDLQSEKRPEKVACKRKEKPNHIC